MLDPEQELAAALVEFYNSFWVLYQRSPTLRVMTVGLKRNIRQIERLRKDQT
jgi:hypothetical protein